jgi:hypothetical protein
MQVRRRSKVGKKKCRWKQQNLLGCGSDAERERLGDGRVGLDVVEAQPLNTKDVLHVRTAHTSLCNDEHWVSRSKVGFDCFVIFSFGSLMVFALCLSLSCTNAKSQISLSLFSSSL